MNYQPKTMPYYSYEGIPPPNYHRFVFFDPPKIGNQMTPVTMKGDWWIRGPKQDSD